MQLENMPWMRLTSHQNTLSLMWCIATLQIWVGIRSISSAHASYPAYMHGPSCLPLATHRLGSPQDTCGPSGPPHMAYCLASLLVRTPCSLSNQLFCQDSMHGGAPSGIQVLIRKWVPLRHHWPRLHHAALHVSGTWSSHPCITICMRNLWKAVVHLQGRCHNGKTGCHLWVTRWSGGSDNRGAGGNIYKATCISKTDHLTSLLYLCSHLWAFMKPVLV